MGAPGRHIRLAVLFMTALLPLSLTFEAPASGTEGYAMADADGNLRIGSRNGQKVFVNDVNIEDCGCTKGSERWHNLGAEVMTNLCGPTLCN